MTTPSEQAPAGQGPRGLPPANLGGVFGRSSKLRGLPPAPAVAEPTDPEPLTLSAPAQQESPPVAITAVPEVAVDGVVSSGAAPRRARKPKKESAAGAKTPAAGEETVQTRRTQTIIYLPVSVADQMRQATRQWNMSNTELALTALDVKHKKLGELLGIKRRPQRTGGLFSSTSRPARTRHEEQTTQVALSLSDEERDIIDGLKDEYGVASRGVLFAVAIPAYLKDEAKRL